MKNVGVIAEFNPFHNGHKYLFDAIRDELNPDGIVCVMSGDFVQRGYPAITDKWTRARAAIAVGADLVIELPTVFSLSSAQDFAYGGIKILEGLGVISDFAFGSESADLAELQRIADINLDNNQELKTLLDIGMSYAAAVSSIIGKDLEPNDILAVEYLKANSKMHPHVIKRKGRGHIATASYIRENMAEIESFVPEDALYELTAWPFWDEEADQKLFEMIRYALMMNQLEAIANILGISEGLENALKKAVISANCLDDIILGAKSKRYTYARISRALMCVGLGIEKFVLEEAKNCPLYARVLAFNETGAKILKEAKKNAEMEIISNLKKVEVLVSPYKNLIETDIQAADIYSILTGRDVHDFSDFVQAPHLE
ncbi:MAG: nucleotidyltransferase family protein [Bacillota bacterium]|nr:nucleotidyltransferase family protein [Bacillota bacterium]